MGSLCFSILFRFLRHHHPPVKFLDLARRPELFDWMVGIRRKIHENPDLGYEEFEPGKLIRDELDKMDIPYTYPVAETDVVGFVGAGSPRFVALRADMDALAIQAHGGTVMLVFQPAEEGGAGAKKIVDAGVLENVGAIFRLHASTEYTIGSVASGAGPVLAGAGSFEPVISGKCGHAAMLQHTIDPILAASKATFQGGGSFDVIPDSVTIGGTFRAFSKDSFIQLKQRIEEVITRQASVHRCNATVIFNSDGEKHFYPVTINDKRLHENLQNVAEQMLGTKSIKEMKPEMGAEDFSFYQEVIPGYVLYVGMADDKKRPFADEHSPFFKVNEDVLLYGAALHASLAARYLL